MKYSEALAEAEGIETLYLPGDREPTLRARAAARERRLNRDERWARMAAYRCQSHKDDAEYFLEPPWKCKYWDPCIFCASLR